MLYIIVEMKRFILCFLFFVILFTASSQKVYFVYLQSEQEQPFFVKMNDRVLSSTASGYLILSSLHDSSYNFIVGFPQNKWPEKSFSVSVNHKDHGFLLKNFGEDGWGLFDLQTSAVQMSSVASINKNDEVKSEKKDISVFTDILSKAADDPSLKEKTVQVKVEEKKPEAQEIVKKEEPKVEIKDTQTTRPVETIEQPVVKKEESKIELKDTSIIKPAETIEQPAVKKEESKVELKEQPVIKKEEEEKIIPAESYRRSLVTKRSESSTTEGFGLVFVDAYENGINDTIRILIPNPKLVTKEIKEEPKTEMKFLDIIPDTSKKEEQKIAEEKTGINEQSVQKAITKNKCADIATENDFLKLRKKMASETTDDGMLDEARKYFKTKCFNVSQAKNISTLFLNDAGKYNFFDAVYLYVTDVENFASLQSELKEDYYIKRFKAMLYN